jgi:hypothetical protein
MEEQIAQTTFKDVIDGIEALFTIIAIIVGGVWTYMLFIKRRQQYPRADITHKIINIPLTNGKTLLRVKTIISNPGEVLLTLASGETRVQQILPLSDDITADIAVGKDPVVEGTEAGWPLLGRRVREGAPCEIEPGEKDEICYDFVIDSGVQATFVYSYYRNIMKKDRDIGWGLTTFNDMSKKVVIETTKEAKK